MIVKRSWMLTAAAAALSAVTITGVAMAANRPIPDPKPNTVFQSEVPEQLPGDQNAWKAALNAPSPVKYRVLVIDDTDGEDRTAYLDRMAEKWGLPAADELYLVLFTKANYDLRFYMGANFRAKGVTVDEMLSLARTHYFTKSQKGDVTGGLADLVTAVNQRMGLTTVFTEKPEVKAPDYRSILVADPLKGGPRWSAAMQVEFAKTAMVAYLQQFLEVDITDRLKEFRLPPDDQIIPLSGDDLNRFEFRMTVDVRPVHAKESSWLAGNGTLGDNGWVTGKTLYVTLLREGDVWRMQSVGTSPATK